MRAGLAGICLVAVLVAGCGAPETEPGPEVPSITPTSSGSAVPPSPPILPAPGPRYAGIGTPPAEPAFTMPPIQPGADWSRVLLEAEMPAGTWLLAFIPIPPGREVLAEDLRRTFEVAADGNTSGAASHVAFPPFLVLSEAGSRMPETIGLAWEARIHADGAPWTYAPALDPLTPFGDTPYAGLLVMAAADTPWRLSFSMEAPWGGNTTVAPEQVTWGRGFRTASAAMRPPEPPDVSSQLSWTEPFPAGWLTVRLDAPCYTASPCADAVAEEAWEVTLPGKVWTESFSRTPAGGTVPQGSFGSLQAPEGDLTVEGTAEGLVGPRTVQAFHVPVPDDAWPFRLDTATFTNVP